MSEFYTTGLWRPNVGAEQEFIEAWREFAVWASGQPGAGVLRLARDLSDPEAFVSFGLWDGIDKVHDWKASPEFRERMGRVQAHLQKFVPSELEVIAAVGTSPADS